MPLNSPGQSHFPESKQVPLFKHLASFLQFKVGHVLSALKARPPGQISQRPVLQSVKEEKYYI